MSGESGIGAAVSLLQSKDRQALLIEIRHAHGTPDAAHPAPVL
jgi:hypothetical protein